MKMLTILFLFLLVSPAFGQSTDEDLQTLKDDLRSIIKEEVSPIIKKEIEASETRMKKYIEESETRMREYIEAFEKRMEGYIDLKVELINPNVTNDPVNLFWVVVIIIAIAIIVPQIIIIYNESKKRSRLETELKELRESIESSKS